MERFSLVVDCVALKSWKAFGFDTNRFGSLCPQHKGIPASWIRKHFC